jgi:hypothetical protein
MRSQHRFALFVAVALAALVGACLGGSSTALGPGGLPPDTLPVTSSDSVITFSISRSAFYEGDTITAFFTVKNVGTTPLSLRGSSGCTFTVRAYRNGALVSPVDRACTADVKDWATIAPGGTFHTSIIWASTSAGATNAQVLAAGVYDIEPYIEGVGFTAAGRRLKVQIVKR